MSAAITKDTTIDKMIEACPKAVGLLIEEGLPCVVCGEPFWGTLGELAAQKGWDDSRIDRLTEKLRELAD